MQQFWLVVGSEKNWHVAFELNNIWGLKDFRELRSLWNMLREGDGLLFYVSKPVHGIVGCGYVARKFKQTIPLWPEELKRQEVLWPLRFEFDVEYCLPPTLWKSSRYTSHDLLMITRMVFQCYPCEEVDISRIALGLRPLNVVPPRSEGPTIEVSPSSGLADHAATKSSLVEIGRIQGFVAQEEYPLESTRLDVVWRRVERSVPTLAFEVQVGGDIYHALAKLKHAYDLWNSHIYLVAAIRDKAKFDELTAGTFHEIAHQVRFIDLAMVEGLLKRKRHYKLLEEDLGIFRK